VHCTSLVEFKNKHGYPWLNKWLPFPDAIATGHQAASDKWHPHALVQAFVHCWLDYCNALLVGAAESQLKWLHVQSVQNTVAWSTVSVRSSTLWPCHIDYTVSTGIQYNTSVSHLQHSSARVEVCPWRCSYISAGTLCPGRRCPRAHMATVCIYSFSDILSCRPIWMINWYK